MTATTPAIPAPTSYEALGALVSEITNNYLARPDADARGAISAICSVYADLIRQVYGEAAVPSVMRSTAAIVEVAIAAKNKAADTNRTTH